MTSINIGGAPPYTIPLDSLDLAFLGKYVQNPRAEKIPLWTKKRFDGELEYCQVQIVTRGNNNEDCYSEDSDTYQCHICNMNVPKMCYQKHNGSEQHETVKKIYQKVLERVSKQINDNSMNTDEDIDQDLYYCEPCSKIIKIENKHNHEATENHAKSVKNLIIKNEFYKILNENISFNVNEDLLGEEIEPFNSNNNYDTFDMNMEADRISSSTDSDEDDDLFDQNSILPPAPEHSILDQSPKEEKKQNFEDYLKEMIKKYDLKVPVPVVDGEFITIVATNGDKVKVFREHFHGYRALTNNMYCQLCDESISGDTRLHDVTEKHVRNIFRPINVGFSRGVNNVWSHCIPCNALVLRDTDLHTLIDKHKKIIEDTQIPKTDKTLCEDCNLYIDTHNFSVHLNSKKHLNVLMKQNYKEEKKQSFEEYLKEMIEKYDLKVPLPVVDGEFITIVAPNGEKVKVSQEHFHGYREKMYGTYCQPCSMWIPKNTRPHDITEKHVRNIFRPINDKFTRWVDTESSHCIPCNMVVLTDSNLHILNDVHKKIIKDTQILKTDKTLCENCNLYIDTHNFSVHLNSKKHLNVLMKQNSIQDTENKDAVFCKICNLTLSKHALKFHIATEKHLARKTNESTLTNKNNDSTINDENNKNNASTVVNDKKNESLSSGLKVTGVGFCELCKVKVPSGGMNMHVNGRSHQSKAAQLSSANKSDVKPKENKVEIDSKPSTSANTGGPASTNRIIDNVASCSSTSSISNYDNGSDHETEKIDAYYDMTEFVDETRTKVRCKICSVNIDFVERNIIEHMKGRNHIENANKQKMEVYKKFLFYADIEKTKLRCQICDVYIPGVEGNIIEHMEGRNHEIAENELLKFHLITRESSEFICECCNIRTKDYIEHMNSKIHTLEFLAKYEIDRTEMRKYVYEDTVNNSVARRHRMLYRNLLEHNWIIKLDDVNHYCVKCQIKLSRISEIDHVLGERHKSKIGEVISSLL